MPASIFLLDVLTLSDDDRVLAQTVLEPVYCLFVKRDENIDPVDECLYRLRSGPYLHCVVPPTHAGHDLAGGKDVEPRKLEGLYEGSFDRVETLPGFPGKDQRYIFRIFHFDSLMKVRISTDPTLFANADDYKACFDNRQRQ